MCSYTVVNILLLVIVLSGNPTAALDKRIVNGKTASDGQYPYQVSLRSNGLHFCGGSILNTYWILTSPTCFAQFIDVTAVVGTNTLNSGGSTYHVASYIAHPLFNPNSLSYAAGLLNTTTSIAYSIKVQPIALTPLLPIDGAIVVISGWGLNHSTSKFPVNELQALNTTAINTTECQRRLSSTSAITSTQICTFAEQAGACVFDHGNPVTVCNIQYAIVVGITCELGFPDAHTKISSVYSWIMSII